MVHGLQELVQLRPRVHEAASWEMVRGTFTENRKSDGTLSAQRANVDG